MPQTEKQNVGNIGENVACQFLEKQGFRIVERNYRKKWGEIDIVAEKDKILHFVEVKTITSKGDYLPEDNVRLWKKQRLSRAIRTYLAERRIPDEQEFEIDVVSVVIDTETGHQKIKLIGNIILD
ncbi:MAG TPA: YraN family protein [Candidatus Paceibacterota bacterium]